MAPIQYVEQWHSFAERLKQTGRFEVAAEIARPYGAEEIAEMESDLAARFGAPGFSILEPLRVLLAATLSLRVQWKLPGATPVVGSVRLTPQDVFETDEEAGLDHVNFWGTERVLELISDTESVVVVFPSPGAAPSLFLRDGDYRFPLELTVERYLEEAWRFRGLYGWQRTLATSGDTHALDQQLADTLGALHS